MSPSYAQFSNRRDAGRQLAAALQEHPFADPIVLALPRGGVPVGYEVAHTLHAPLDVLLVRKLGAPGYEEFGIGALVDGADPHVVLNEDAIEMLRVPPTYIEQETDRQLVEVERRRKLYCGNTKAAAVDGRTVIIVDDGVATGGTVLVAIKAIRDSSAERVVVAVPIAPPDTLAKLTREADEVVCLFSPTDFRAVGAHYTDFEQTSDAEVIELLAAQRAERAQ